MTAIMMALAMTGCAATSPQQTAAAIAGNMAGVSPIASQSPALVGLLVQQLGISPAQAMGGAGSIFSVAQQMMTPNNFGLVSNSVPGMSQMLAAAPKMAGYGSGAGGLMGSAASALGGGSSLGQMAMLASSFQNLGLGTGMVNQFIPVILQYVQTQGGASTMGLLQSALMP